MRTQRPAAEVTSSDTRLPLDLDAISARFVRDLSGSGRDHDAAVAKLHVLLIRVARGESRRCSNRWGITGPELEDLAHQAAADALLAILAKVGQFRGESRFTTWAYRFVVLEVSMKLGRHYWRTHPPRAHDEGWDVLPDRFGLTPQQRAEWLDLVAALRRSVDEDLTPYQRTIFVGLVLHDVPLDALVVRLGSSRAAIHKAMFDARRKLRLKLAANGYVDHETSSILP
jgi:RNA polymerase sigma-70 factor (ECF subfamily)